MQDIGLLLRSYADDFDYAQRLVESFRQHNADALTLYVVVSTPDMEHFGSLASRDVVVMDDSALTHYFTDTEVHGIRPGYVNQEIVKLAFWELRLTRNYFCVDSDAVFIRDFSAQDFLATDGFPFSVLVEDKELLVEPRYFADYWQSREQALIQIAREVGLNNTPLLTCHGHQIFSSAVLQSFRDDFLEPRGWTYLDALRVSPYEFSWYNFWLQKVHTIPIHAREPLVKVFHHERHHMEYLLRGVTAEDIARGYLAVVVNSNYSRDLGLVPTAESKEASLARYLSYGELWKLLGIKFGRSFARVLGRSQH